MSATRPYRPSNGSEGASFQAAFCDRCGKDANEGCRILTYTMAFGIDDPEYPEEWIQDVPYDPQSARCTAFEARELTEERRRHREQRVKAGRSWRSAERAGQIGLFPTESSS